MKKTGRSFSFQFFGRLCGFEFVLKLLAILFIASGAIIVLLYIPLWLVMFLLAIVMIIGGIWILKRI